jgi:hypothetical protein
MANNAMSKSAAILPVRYLIGDAAIEVVLSGHDAEYEQGAMTDSTTWTELWEIPVRLINPNPRQPRTAFDEAASQELTESIQEHGLIQPVIVNQNGRDDEYTLLAGERRWRAAQIAGLDVVPCIVKAHVDDRVMTEIAIISALQVSPAPHGFAGFTGAITGEFFIFHTRYFDVNIKAVEKRAGDPFLIARVSIVLYLGVITPPPGSNTFSSPIWQVNSRRVPEGRSSENVAM